MFLNEPLRKISLDVITPRAQARTLPCSRPVPRRNASTGDLDDGVELPRPLVVRGGEMK
jgi:hypothetical protein